MPFYLAIVEVVMKKSVKKISKAETGAMEKEVRFLTDMKTNRSFTFGGRDLKFLKIIKQSRSYISPIRSFICRIINHLQANSMTLLFINNED